MNHLIIGDTETSGLGPDAGVCEVAFVEIDDDMQIISTHRSLINPQCKISAGAAGVHRITDDMVKDAPTLAEYMAATVPHYQDREILLIAHNAQFDAKFFNPYFGKLHQFCTLKMARRVWPEAENHKLATLMFYLGIEIVGSHNALDDVMTTHGMLLKAAEKQGTDLEGLYNLINAPAEILVCPLGKHKGVPMREVPKSYLRWMKNTLTDMDDDLKRAVDKHLGII